jgi:hypothetical protein
VSDPAPPPELPSSPDEPSGGRSLGLFILGVAIGITAVVIAGFLGATKSVVMICVAELAAVLLLLLVLSRFKRRALMAGFLTGVAVMFLLCAACFGVMIGMLRSGGK